MKVKELREVLKKVDDDVDVYFKWDIDEGYTIFEPVSEASVVPVFQNTAGHPLDLDTVVHFQGHYKKRVPFTNHGTGVVLSW